jgi:hypothetical protein
LHGTSSDVGAEKFARNAARIWHNLPDWSPPDTDRDFATIGGITFDEAWENRIAGLIDKQIKAAVISRGDLVRNKLATEREQDALDVKKLRGAQNNRD